jgi:lycopene cyclase domain-containing protein
LLIPFFIVNGILTGFGIDEEVFSYDQKYIIGVYLFTMPLEDMFYAFSLLISVIAFTEILEKRFSKTISQAK